MSTTDVKPSWRSGRMPLLAVAAIYGGIAASHSVRASASGIVWWGFAAVMAMLAWRRPATVSAGRAAAVMLLLFLLTFAGVSAPRWLAGP